MSSRRVQRVIRETITVVGVSTMNVEIDIADRRGRSDNGLLEFVDRFRTNR